MKFVESLGYKVYSDDLSKIILSTKQPKLISTISPNSYGIATKNKDFKEALKNTDFLVLDGVYFALASILLQRKNIKKNQGPDVFYHFMDRLNTNNGKAFFLGSSEQTLTKIKENAKIKHPNLIIQTYSPPYKPKFTKEENEEMITTINQFEPDILFVGMTAPKQEIWAYQHKDKIKAKLIICIGGVFDWYARNYKEIPKIWWTLRLGWLVRYTQRPEIILRDTKNDLVFFAHLILKLIYLR